MQHSSIQHDIGIVLLHVDQLLKESDKLYLNALGNGEIPAIFHFIQILLYIAIHSVYSQ